MKKKYYGFISFIIFIIALIGIGYYSIYYIDNMPRKIYIPKIVSIPKINIPSKKLIQHINYIKTHLSNYMVITKKIDKTINNKYVDLRLFNNNSIDYNKKRLKPIIKVIKTNKSSHKITIKSLNKPSPKLENDFSHVLSLAFYSKKHRYCIIDGKLYTEKALLPRGGKIEKIKRNKVLISKNNKKVWLYLFSKSYKK